MSWGVCLKKKILMWAKRSLGGNAEGVLYRPELSEAVVTDKVTSGLAFEVWNIFASQIRGQMPSSQMKTPEGERALGFWGVDLLVAWWLDVWGTLGEWGSCCFPVKCGGWRAGAAVANSQVLRWSCRPQPCPQRVSLSAEHSSGPRP